MGLRERLLQTRGQASSRRINEVIHPTIEVDANAVFSALPDEVKARLERGSKNLDRKKRFLRNIKSLLEGRFSFFQLLKMDEECVDNKGRIDEGRLANIINGKYDD